MPNWGHVLQEIQKERDDPPGGDAASDKIRLKYLMQLHRHTGRNIICYYSGWLSKPKVEGVEVTDEDKNGLMLCVHKLDRSLGLDLLIHTPGGSGYATESFIDYLKSMFGNDIRAFVPQIAMSAGTIMACACKEIWMGKHSNLGPVDPQINGIPAYAVLEELKLAYDDMIKDNRKQLIWNPILSRYTPSFVQQCTWAVANSKDFLAKFLRDNMFSHLSPQDRDKKVADIADRLTNLAKNTSHSKHLNKDECKSIGLKIKDLEDRADKTLQDLVLTVHHCFMFALSNTPAFKIIENHTGKRHMKIVVEGFAPPNVMFVPAPGTPSSRP